MEKGSISYGRIVATDIKQQIETDHCAGNFGLGLIFA